MKRFFVLFLLLFGISISNAQLMKSVFLGGSNYIGDIGNTTYINPKDPAFGLVYKCHAGLEINICDYLFNQRHPRNHFISS